MVDMSLMGSVYVDPAEKTAVVDGGALACYIDAETALHGLAVPLGVCAVVGVGGLALHGGLSVLSRAHGATCDSLLEAQLVLADGSVVHATKDGPDPELLWALKGAGSLFGIVTKVKLQLYEAPTYSGAMVWKDDPEHVNYKAILRWIRSTVLPNPCLGFNCGRMLDPELGPVLVSMVVVTGEQPVEEKAALLQPLRDLGTLQDTVGQSTWLQTQMTHYEGVTGLTEAYPGHFEAATGGHVKAEHFTDEFIDTYVRCATEELPLPDLGLTLSFIELMGGALKDSTSPIGLKEGDLQWVVQAGWSDAAANPVGLRYTGMLREVLGPLSTSMSQYVNLLDVAEDLDMSYESAAAKAGGAANLEKIRALKAKYDPTGVFLNSPYTKVLAVKP